MWPVCGCRMRMAMPERRVLCAGVAGYRSWLRRRFWKCGDCRRGGCRRLELSDRGMPECGTAKVLTVG